MGATRGSATACLVVARLERLLERRAALLAQLESLGVAAAPPALRGRLTRLTRDQARLVGELVALLAPADGAPARRHPA